MGHSKRDLPQRKLCRLWVYLSYQPLNHFPCLLFLDLNVDEATNGGPTLLPVSSPLLAQALFEVAREVHSPLDNSLQVDIDWELILQDTSDESGHTVYSDWLHQTKLESPSFNEPRIDTIGTGSDFTIFQHRLGISSADLVFSGGQKDAVFQYHSKYDSFFWMEKFGDPGFRKHEAMAKLWGLLALRLASQAILGFSATSYARQLSKGFSVLDISSDVDYDKLSHVIEVFSEEALKLDREAEKLRLHLKISNLHESTSCSAINSINNKFRSIERGFLNEEGLPHRHWYKHMVCS
jgi:N-acetylated-alpha-linked acidic dipeptidase